MYIKFSLNTLVVISSIIWMKFLILLLSIIETQGTTILCQVKYALFRLAFQSGLNSYNI